MSRTLNLTNITNIPSIVFLTCNKKLQLHVSVHRLLKASEIVLNHLDISPGIKVLKEKQPKMGKGLKRPFGLGSSK